MGSGGSNPPLSARSKNAKTRTTSVSFLWQLAGKQTSLFSRPAVIKCCALLLCVFGTEASPPGNTERLWREGNPPGSCGEPPPAKVIRLDFGEPLETPGSKYIKGRKWSFQLKYTQQTQYLQNTTLCRKARTSYLST